MRILASILMLLALALPWQAYASTHEKAYAEIADSTGISIAPLVHGQMIVIDDNRSAIMALADVYAADPIVAKLTAYGTSQHRRALYGLWPKTLADAETPFHLPTHAYLAAARATLIRLHDIAPADDRVSALADVVDKQMILNEGTSLSLCQYSDLSFNTLTPVTADWSKLSLSGLSSPRIVITFGMFAAMALMLLVARKHVLLTFKQQNPRFNPRRLKA